jgi:hypothetical protein
VTPTKLESRKSMAAKDLATGPRQNKLDQGAIERPKRSLLRQIRIKIGGKVADIFTW